MKTQLRTPSQYKGCDGRGGSGLSSRVLHHETLPKNKTDFPTFRSNAERCTEPCASLYSRYKKATLNFKQAMQSVVPEEIFTDSVAGLMNAAEYVAAHFTSVDDTVMEDLKLAIRVRQRVATSVYGGGDDGHSHFISVLSYCWSCLRLLERKKRSRPLQETTLNAEEDKNKSENRFAALVEEDCDEDVDDDDEEDLPSSEVVRPRIDEAAPHAMTLDELATGEDRTDAIFFLMTLDDLMGHNSLSFRKLKKAYLYDQHSNASETSIISLLLEVSTTVNFSIQQVASLEQELVAQHPHLSTIYRLLAIVQFHEGIHNLSKLVRQLSPRAKEFREADAVAFVGDAIECVFRSPTDPDNRYKTIDNDFCSEWQLKKDDLRSIMMDMQCITFFAHKDGIVDRSWLPNSAFIGGTDRPIMHTIHMLQGISVVIRKHVALQLKPGFLGQAWDESRKNAEKIATDFDSMLMGDILPHLLSMCNSSLLSTSLPYENELLPLFVQLRKFSNDPRNPISWTLAFSVHAVLTSIFEVQGENCVRGLGEISKATFQHYMDQLQHCIDRSDVIANSKYWSRNLGLMSKLRWLVVSPIKGTPRSEYIALWNPLCAGSFIGYLAYFLNVDCGSSTVDSFCQLRIVLHLFNGLIKQGALTPGKLPILDALHSRFGDCKAVWGGPLPERGEFVKRWWIAYGMKIMLAIAKSEETKTHWVQSLTTNRSPKPKFDTARPPPIKPEEMAPSYRRICLRSFTGAVAVDKHLSAREKRSDKGTFLYEHKVRVNETLHWIHADQGLLAMNLTSVGEILNQFVNGLCIQLEWKPLVEQIARETPRPRVHRQKSYRQVASNSLNGGDDNTERHALVHFIAENLFGCLDFHPDPCRVPAIARTAAFMKVFFAQIDPSSIMWFTPTQESEDDE